ncbi:MAG: DNA polymerase III subunit gamma/tau [Verrucomicrobia bacterium]|nr:DNA polymerase III subunit gamma/tau [Verrucomicrobiota bacterium]
MSYQVIARKYRPQRFADVVGQEHVTTTLANAIRLGRIAHGYLFCGPRGTGKTTLARIFAKALNCTGGPSVEFDDADPRVKEITEGRSLDVLEIDGASNNGVDQVRELRDTAKFAPASGKFKIYIIDEVHMLSTAAFNALLKTLEEPPPHVKFLFATTDPEKVLPTILSRCQRFDLRRIPAALIVKHLAWIAEQEKVSIDPDALLAIARGADGGMRDAESTLDQLISFCGDRIVESDVLSMFGLAARAQLMHLVDALLEGDVATTLRLLEELTSSGKDLGRLLADLLNHFRNLLLFQVSGFEAGLLNVSEAEMGALTRQAKHIDADALTRVMEVLSAAEGRQREVASKRIFMEVTLLKVIQAREATSLDAVLKQLKAMRDQVPAGPAVAVPAASATKVNSAAPVTPPAPVVTPTVLAPTVVSPPVNPPLPKPPVASVPSVAPVLNPPAAAVSSIPIPSGPAKSPLDSAPLLSESSQTIEAVWQVLMAQLPHSEGLLRAALQQSRAESWSRDTLTIAHPPEAYLDTARNIGTLQTVLQTITGKKVTLRFVVSESLSVPEPVVPVLSPATSPRESARPSASEVKPTEAKPKAVAPVLLNKDEFLNDPLIRQALEVFKGRIMEVRGPSEAS